jgi:rSAM/selenodomain-associated transferase 2
LTAPPRADSPGLTLSIVVPVLNEAASIGEALAALAPMRRRAAELIVVDGGSRDGTPNLASPHADQVLSAPRGRASQMNAGARAARGEVLLFLHADTRLPADADLILCDGLARSGKAWGRFDVRIEGSSSMLPIVAWSMNLRSRLTGICTGDQAIFVTRAAFDRAGGYPNIALMEDVALSAALRRVSRPLALRERVTTSGRRWEKRGVIPTILLMWRLRLAYFFGAHPEDLARRYGYGPREE